MTHGGSVMCDVGMLDLRFHMHPKGKSVPRYMCKVRVYRVHGVGGRSRVCSKEQHKE